MPDDGRIAAPAAAPGQRPQAGGELCQCEWLDQVIVGAAVEAGYTVMHAVARGQQQDWRGILLRAAFFQYFQARLARQVDIDYRCVVVLVDQCQFASHAVAHPVHRVAGLFQPGLDAVAQQLVVFNQQYPHRCSLRQRVSSR